MSQQSNGGKAIKAGLGYTAGNILIRGLSFLALPIFSRLMDTDQFGIYNGFIAIDSILYVITGLALHSSVKSAHYTFRGETDKYVSSLSIIYLFTFTIFNFIVMLYGEKIGVLLGLPIPALYMLILYSSGSALLTLYNYRISLDYSYKRYLILSLVNTAGNISLSLLLILTVFNDSRAMGRIVGSSVTIALIAVFLLQDMWRKAKPKINKSYWKFGIKYSLPIISHGVSQVLLSQFDRIMIRSLDSNASAGIYSLAGNIRIILTVISESISTAWSTWFFEEFDKGNKSIIQKRATQLVWVFAFLSIGMMAVSPELILLLGGKNYELGKYVAYPMIIDAFILFMYNVIVPSEYYMKKTKYIMLGTMVAASINIITNYIFIKKYGFVAAAYTTLFSYVCYVVLHLIISRKLVKFFIIPIKELVLMVCIIGVTASIDMALINRVFFRFIVNVFILVIIAFTLIRYLRKDGIDIIAFIKSRFFKTRTKI